MPNSHLITLIKVFTDGTGLKKYQGPEEGRVAVLLAAPFVEEYRFAFTG